MKLNIGGHTYKIKVARGLESEDGRMLLGYHDARVAEIVLDKEMIQSRKVETMLHEVLHVILTNTGNKHDEGMIDSIANGLHQLGVGDYLWKKAKR